MVRITCFCPLIVSIVSNNTFAKESQPFLKCIKRSIRHESLLLSLSRFFLHYQWSCNIILLCLVPSRPLSSYLTAWSPITTSTGSRPPRLTHFPGVTKEEIRVEVEDSTYMSIRTEAMVDGEREPARKFAGKFRLPAMVDVNGITAGYEDEVLTVRVPRELVRSGFFIDPSDSPGATEVLATARAA